MPRMPPPPPPEATRQLHPLEIECREAFVREAGYGTPATDIRYRDFRNGWFAGRYGQHNDEQGRCRHSFTSERRHTLYGPAEGRCTRCRAWAADLPQDDPYAPGPAPLQAGAQR